MKRFHVLFMSVLVFALLLVAVPATQARTEAPSPSIVDIAVSNPDVDGDGEGDFDTLVAAVLAADPSVFQALSSRGQYTVFAPTDAAFAATLAELGISDPNDLLNNTELLTSILLYHVAHGSRDAADIVSSSRVRTLQRGFLMQSGGVLTDNNGRDANIIATDIFASNGVIHVIDNVVLP